MQQVANKPDLKRPATLAELAFAAGNQKIRQSGMVDECRCNMAGDLLIVPAYVLTLELFADRLTKRFFAFLESISEVSNEDRAIESSDGSICLDWSDVQAAEVSREATREVKRRFQPGH